MRDVSNTNQSSAAIIAYGHGATSHCQWLAPSTDRGQHRLPWR